MQQATVRAGAKCACGIDIEISSELLGTTKEWMILYSYKCTKWNKNKMCVINGCKIYTKWLQWALFGSRCTCAEGGSEQKWKRQEEVYD
jgi:hypothetical protein